MKQNMKVSVNDFRLLGSKIKPSSVIIAILALVL